MQESGNWLLQHENAPGNWCLLVHKYLFRNGTTLLSQAPYTSALKIEAVCSSKMLVSTYTSTLHYSPEDQLQHTTKAVCSKSHHYENSSHGKKVTNTIFTRIKDDPAYKTVTIFNFQENTNIHICQVFMSLIVCVFNILELNNHRS
jgi:hypothetical protein